MPNLHDGVTVKSQITTARKTNVQKDGSYPGTRQEVGHQLDVLAVHSGESVCGRLHPVESAAEDIKRMGENHTKAII